MKKQRLVVAAVIGLVVTLANGSSAAAEGLTAIGDSTEATLLAVGITGSARSSAGVAISGGGASGALAAVAGTGDADANGGLVAVSVLGDARGGTVNIDLE